MSGHGTAGMTDASELKQQRKNLGLSIAKAARQVKVHPRTWARWESGRQEIPEGAAQLFRILNKLEKVQ